jgi:hypothetical protein
MVASAVTVEGLLKSRPEAFGLPLELLGGARGDPIGTDEHRLVAEAYRPAPVQDEPTTGPGSEP